MTELFDPTENRDHPDEQDSQKNDCSHMVLLPRWDSVGDMGNESRAVGYRCDACGADLSLKEAEEGRRRHAIAL